MRSSKLGIPILVVLALGAARLPARADPILSRPPLGRGAWRGSGIEPRAIGVLGEIQVIGVGTAELLTTLPGYGTVSSDSLELGLARVGLIAAHPCRPLTLVVRVDVSEPLRIDSEQVDHEPMAVVDAVVDDAALWWTPYPWASLVAGRSKVPFSRFRQLERALLPAGVVPFLVDRVAPDRRWGLTTLGDLGAIAYAGGVYADADRLELVRTDADPSAHGRIALALHLEWTPRAPIGVDHQATASDDPWHDEVRVSAGIGGLYRLRAENGRRLDLSLSGQIKYQRYSAIAELLLSSDDARLALGGSAEAGVVFTDRVSVFGRGDYDAEVGLFSSGGGLAYFVSRDRRSKVSVFGWLRRADGEGGPSRDGLIVQLQSAL